MNEKNKVTCVCESSGYAWRIHASELPDGITFKIKTLQDSHVCKWVEKNHLATTNWIATRFIELFKINPEVKVAILEFEIYKKFTLKVDIQKLYRAKRIAFKMLNGDHIEYYHKLHKNGNVLVTLNHGTIVNVRCVRNMLNENPTFQKFLWVFLHKNKDFLMVANHSLV